MGQHFKNEKEKKKFKGEKLTVKIKHKFKGFFPRFVAGNVYNNFSDISLTHTYYDTSLDQTKSQSTKIQTKKYFDSVISVPFDKNFEGVEVNLSKFCKNPL